MEDTKIQWHPGFVAAMDMELTDNRENLIFEKEYNLNTKPLEINLLIIKKNTNIPVTNEIGHIFKGHNIIEYKSPDDSLDIDAFYKSIAYACLYKSYGKTLDERKADDITVSILRDAKPIELFKYLKKHGYSLSTPYQGVYYVNTKVLFSTQIIVTRELDEEVHTWLRVLSDKVKTKDAQNLLNIMRNLKGNYDREMADSVFRVMMDANEEMIKEWRGDAAMFESLMEFMEPELQVREAQMRKEWRKEWHKEWRKEEIERSIDMLKKFGHKDSEIKTAIMNQYQLSSSEADGYLA